MWSEQTDVIEKDKIIHYRLFSKDRAISFSKLLQLWQQDESFVDYFNGLLASSPWPAFFWELPSLSCKRLGADAEFVLVNSPELAVASPDPLAFDTYFEKSHGMVTSFDNLGGDAKLLVPLPHSVVHHYTHLATFVREAPQRQRRVFWRELGDLVQAYISEDAFWLSTSGLSVSWLHVRLDSIPKYYQHTPYKSEIW